MTGQVPGDDRRISMEVFSRTFVCKTSSDDRPMIGGCHRSSEDHRSMSGGCVSDASDILEISGENNSALNSSDAPTMPNFSLRHPPMIGRYPRIFSKCSP